jgi:hypothetical protein
MRFKSGQLSPRTGRASGTGSPNCFHATAGTDVSGWIAGIARRRAGERLRGARVHCGGCAADDRRSQLALDELLADRVNVNEPAPVW